MCRILKERQPKCFIAENVKGILTANKKSAFPLIMKEFEDSGYNVQYRILNSANYGVPQKRERRERMIKNIVFDMGHVLLSLDFAKI